MSHDSEEWYKVWRKTDSWLSESVKIENSWQKSFLEIEWSSKTLWKMISADVKRKTTRNKNLVALSYKSLLDIPPKL